MYLKKWLYYYCKDIRTLNEKSSMYQSRSRWSMISSWKTERTALYSLKMSKTLDSCPISFRRTIKIKQRFYFGSTSSREGVEDISRLPEVVRLATGESRYDNGGAQIKAKILINFCSKSGPAKFENGNPWPAASKATWHVTSSRDKCLGFQSILFVWNRTHFCSWTLMKVKGL